MLPPVLEIYIVWHPSDRAGEAVALEFFRHFHGSRYTGLMADAVEVFLRSHGWLGDNGPPRPIYTPATPPPRGLSQAQLTVIVPIVDMELARAARLHDKPWARYMTDLVRDCDDSPNRCTIIPVILDPNAMRGVLGTIIGSMVPAATHIQTSSTPTGAAASSLRPSFGSPADRPTTGD
jgi:hypothetical protein